MPSFTRSVACLVLYVCSLSALDAQTPFITIWQTDNPGSSNNNQIILPINGFFYQIDWEEVGNVSNNGTLTGDFGSTTITFPSSGTYRLSIQPGIGLINSFQLHNGGDEEKIIDIEQWGTLAWNSMGFAFSGCDSLKAVTASDIPNLSNANSVSFMFSSCDNLTEINNLGTWDLGGASNMDGMFSFCPLFNQDIGSMDVSGIASMAFVFDNSVLFNQDIGGWDVSNVTNMLGMFNLARTFDQDISMWITSNVELMDQMFTEADSFNQDIGNWNTAKVEGMTGMFFGAESFNQDIGDWEVGKVRSMHTMLFGADSFNHDIGDWDVSSVENMESMFGNASVFNQDIGDWDVSSVTVMSTMFAFADSFNQDISSWDVSNVVDMSEMFRGLPLFDQDLRYWDVSSATDMSGMFDGALVFNQPLGAWQLRAGVNLTEMLDRSGLDCISYSNTLTGWAGNPATPDDLSLGADSIRYGTGAIPARNVLLGKGWTITDLGESASCDYNPVPFITLWDSEKMGVTSDIQIIIPAIGTTFTIEWEEVGSPLNSGMLIGNGATTVTFPSAGIYRVNILPGSGNFEGLVFDNAGDRLKIIEVEQWGTANWPDLQDAFYGCENLFISAVDVLQMSGVTSMSNLFRSCNLLERVPNITGWATGPVTDMEGLFMDASVFNQSIGQMDVGNVQNMRSMCEGATLFNGNISQWNVSNVEDMGRMFSNAQAFDQPLSDWDTGNVENMEYMFNQASSFNQILGVWDLGSLDTMSLSPMEGMLSFSGMDCPSYSFTLMGWADNVSTPDSMILGSEDLVYSPDAASAHNLLTITMGWIINNDSLDINCELFSDKFITIWKTNNTGTSANNQITIPGTGSNYSIEWEDFFNPSTNGSTNGTGTSTVTFPDVGTYRVKISPGAGSFNKIFMAGAGDRLKLLKIENWGNIAWSTMENAFNSCTNLTVTTKDTINLSAATSTRAMFQNCTSLTIVPKMDDWDMSTITSTALMFYSNHNFIQPIGSWNVSNVTDMSYMFFDAPGFNKDIGGWNTQSVENMSYMFNGASAFNQDIGMWNTMNVTDMSFMFKSAFAFNQDLNWNTGKVTTMQQMFFDAIAFDGDIGGWITSKVEDINFMFSGAAVFNQDLSGWTTDSLKSMFNAFENAAVFNQDIGGWNTAGVTTMSGLFDGATAFNQNIGSWNTSKVKHMGTMFRNAISFNQAIGGWNTDSVIAMSQMFRNAASFNQDLSTWQTSGVTATVLMFAGATAFDQNIGAWDMSSVTLIASMFNGATAFKGDIENWNVSSATSLNSMFKGATSFDRDLGGWDVANVTNMTAFLENAGLSVVNYDSLLIGWSDQVLQTDVVFDAGGSQYCTGSDARDSILANFNWTILDGGPRCTTIWTGDESTTDWFTPGNWTNGVPQDFYDVIVPDVSPSPFPEVVGSLGTCRTIEVQSGASIVIGASGDLDVVGEE